MELARVIFRNPYVTREGDALPDWKKELPLNFTVRKMKEYLEKEYPGKPVARDIRLVFSGKMLSDGTVTLKKILENALLVIRLLKGEKIKSDLQFLEFLGKNRVQLVIINTQKHYWLMKKLGAEIISNHADFRMITRRVLNEFLKFNENNLFIRATFPMIGFTSCVVYYDRPERKAGKTKYPFRKMLEFAIDGLTSFSVVPLRICSLVGLFVSLLALLMLLWSLVVNIIGGAIPGWTSTVAPLYLLGGVQLLFLGIVGEYIGKIYSEVKNRPRYIVQETVNFNNENVPG